MNEFYIRITSLAMAIAPIITFGLLTWGEVSERRFAKGAVYLIWAMVSVLLSPGIYAVVQWSLHHPPPNPW